MSFVTMLVLQIWTEYTERNPSDQAVGNVNFLPGMGAFIQSIVYGFAGFRIRPDKLEVHNPQPPPGSNAIVMTNFYYLGSNLTFTITADKTVIRVLASSPIYPLLLLRNTSSAVEETLRTGWTICQLFVYWSCRYIFWRTLPSKAMFVLAMAKPFVCPSATNMRWWRCTKTVIARNTERSRNICVGKM